MTQKPLENIEKIYDLAVTTKHHTEERRDEINKYYISLFTAILAIMPFINNIIEQGKVYSTDSVKLLLVLMSLSGLTLAISWVLTLKRIYHYIDGLDKFLVSLEEKHKEALFTFVLTYLEQIRSPDKVTKQEMLVPYTFMVIFLLTLAYSIKLLI